MDSGSSHTSKQTRAFLAGHPRFVAHYTPKHASWANQVEPFFSVIQRKVIKEGNFPSRDDLVSKLMRFTPQRDGEALRLDLHWNTARDSNMNTCGINAREH